MPTNLFFRLVCCIVVLGMMAKSNRLSGKQEEKSNRISPARKSPSTSGQVAGNKRVYQTKVGKIEVSISPEKPSIMLGEPIYLEFKIRNLTSHKLFVVQGGDYRNRLGRPESYRISAIAPDGKPLKTIDAGMSMGGIMGPREIEKTSGWSRKLFLPNWFEFRKHGKHTIHCKTKLRICKTPDFTTQTTPDSTDVPVELEFSINVDKRKMTEFSRLVSALGKKAVASHDEDAIRKLMAIDDEQVVSYFLDLVKLENYSMRFKALQGLSRFSSDRALSGIEIGLSTSVAEMRKNSSNDRVAGQLVRNIRHSASVALSNSPHPNAEKRLLELWDDPNYAIRITVLHRLGKLKDPESLMILKKMTLDRHPTVKKEAERYYGLRTR